MSSFTPEELAKFEEHKQRQAARRADPLYSTTSSEVGEIPRGVDPKTVVEAPKHGKGSGEKFSAGFIYPRPRDTRLDTTMPKNRFCKEKDGY